MENAEKTKRFWSKGLGAWLYRKYAGKHFSKMHEVVAGQILAKNPKDVLDIACGPGDFLFYLSNLAPNIKLSGTDIAPGMVRHAEEKLAGRATILESAGESQPFPENSFDVITIMMSFHHFHKKEEALINMGQLLRPGGTLFIVDIVAKNDFQKSFWNFLEKITNIRGYVGHYTEKEIREMARNTNFSFSIQYVEGMPKRYRICKLEK